LFSGTENMSTKLHTVKATSAGHFIKTANIYRKKTAHRKI